MGAMPAPPSWIDAVRWSIVTMAEGRFGICRMLLWFRDGSEADVALPDPEYTRIVRALGHASDRAVLYELWRRGWLPDQRPSNGAAAPCLLDEAPDH
jgi:hypothetical protein